MSKITEASRDTTCIRCGAPDCFSAHYNGPRQHHFGKGRGVKANDLMTADFFHQCDQRFSEGSTSPDWKDKWDRSEEFMYWIALSNIRRFENGIIKI